VPFVHADLVLETTNTTGTGTLTLAGAVADYLTFSSQVGAGNTCSYTLEASNGQKETGVGTVGTGTLERTTLVSSSTGAKLDLPAGTHYIGVTTNSRSFLAISTLDAVTASETLAAGDMVNLHTVTGALRVQKADGSGTTKPINGYVRSAITSGATGTVYSLGIVSGLTGLTPGGDCWLSQTTAGAVTQTAPNEATTGKTIQMAGKAVSASTMLFQPGPPILT